MQLKVIQKGPQVPLDHNGTRTFLGVYDPTTGTITVGTGGHSLIAPNAVPSSCGLVFLESADQIEVYQFGGSFPTQPTPIQQAAIEAALQQTYGKPIAWK